MFRLKSQDGAFVFAKAESGGCGIRNLAVINCPPCGYDVQYVKSEVRSSCVYIIPLNSDIDESPVTVNDLSTAPAIVAECKCSNCHKTVALTEFQNHKEICLNEYDLISGAFFSSFFFFCIHYYVQKPKC